ncbi:DNA-binding protein [Streptomyces sp. NPDC015125]|uniref:DNA-binding protein n=1 Tax=Streptomyces sp. NPDC015125 TaxID=3364938 RepID=UPI0036FA1B44
MPEVNMPELHLVTEDLAAYWTGRPASTIRRWGIEGRITRHEDHSQRRNGIRYDVWELPAAKRDENGRIIERGSVPRITSIPAANAA